MSFEIGRPRSRVWKNMGRSWSKGVGGLENCIIFMDVICVSSLTVTNEPVPRPSTASFVFSQAKHFFFSTS